MSLSLLNRFKINKHTTQTQIDDTTINVVLKTSVCATCKKEKPNAFFKCFNGAIYSSCNKCLKKVT